MSFLICFEGIDGSGKTTQLNMLLGFLQKNGSSVLARSYPVYSSFFGKEIGRLLSAKEHEKTASSLDSRSMALWYALDRWLDYQANLPVFAQNDYVLLNRYTLSSIVYQSLRSQDYANVQEWVDNLEHSVLGLPRPDLYIIFDIIPELAKSNIQKKGKRDYIDDATDVYESDASLQARARELYLEMAKDLPNARVIQCYDGGFLLNRQDIFKKVIASLNIEIRLL